MLLAADIGNTNITLGAFQGKRLAETWRLDSAECRSPGALGRHITRLLESHIPIAERKVDGVIYGSVVPGLSPVFAAAVKRSLGRRAIAVTPKSRLGIRLRVDKPSEVGADRLLNSLAAFRMSGGPVVVLDFGTATTFDCVSTCGDYLGGAILLGPHLAAKALSLNTAKLPAVEIRPTRRVIGKNTVECIQAGLYWGYLGMVERVLKQTIEEMRKGREVRIRVVATGGLAGLFVDAMPRVSRVIPDLTLQGLRIAYETIC